MPPKKSTLVKGKGASIVGGDYKKKFKEVSKQVYSQLTSDEAKLIGKSALTTLILGIMGYGVGKVVQKSLKPPVITRSAHDIELELRNKENEDKSKQLAESHNMDFDRIVKEILDFKEVNRKQQQLASDIKEYKDYFKEYYPYEYGVDSEDINEDGFQETKSNNPIVKPSSGKGLKGGKEGDRMQSIKAKASAAAQYLHKVVTSKEAKGLGAAALASLIMAGLGAAGYKAHQHTQRINTDKSQRDTARLNAVLDAAKLKNAIPKGKAPEVIDILEQELDDDEETKNDINTHLAALERGELPLGEIKTPHGRGPLENWTKSPYDSDQEDAYLEDEVKDTIVSDLNEMFKELESDTMKAEGDLDEYIEPGPDIPDPDNPFYSYYFQYNDPSLHDKEVMEIYKIVNNLVDDVVQQAEVQNASGKGMKGKGFSKGDVKKVKDKIYKIITSPKAKTIGAAALSTLVMAALGGLGSYYHNKMLQESVRQDRANDFISRNSAAWDIDGPPHNVEGRASHFVGNGLKASEATQKADTDKGLKIASKKIANLIQYARDLNLDKAALFSLITFLLGGVGYGGFRYIKGKARESEPFGYVPEGEVIQSLEDFATGKHRLPEHTRNANISWISTLGFGLKKKLKGGDLSKFGEYAKKKEEGEKKAKPIAKKITDWIYSDEAKLIGKAAIQYTILTALGLLTAYAGKKVGETAISVYPKDRTKINDPNLFDDMIVEPSEEDIQAFENRPKYATTDVLNSVFKGLPSDEILNLQRFALEHPKNTAAKNLLESHNVPHISDTLLRTDPSLSTIFHYKSPKKDKKHPYPEKYVESITDYYKAQGAAPNKSKIPVRINKSTPASDVLSYILEQRAVEPPTESSVAEIIRSVEPLPKKERKQRHSLASILESVAAHESDDDETKDDGGGGLKEDLNNFGKISAKKINEAGDAIYKVITSPQVQGVAGKVTTSLIVSVLTMLMHEKRQETLASRRARVNEQLRSNMGSDVFFQ
jgi:hypothetical protein